MAILVLVDDLIFLSKIRETAKLVNAEVEVVQPAMLCERLASGSVSAVICDLNFRPSLEAVRATKRDFCSIPIIGFLSHVQAELAAAAREAGCDTVIARSAFTLHLPELLRQYSPARHAQ